MPGPLIDCYVLAPQRTAALALAFLDRFLPEREPCFDPTDPSDVLGIPAEFTLLDIMKFLQDTPDMSYSMYWRNRHEEVPHNAIVAFNADGSLILGLSPCVEDRGGVAESYLAQMKAFVKTADGILSCEMPPPITSREFIDMMSN